MRRFAGTLGAAAVLCALLLAVRWWESATPVGRVEAEPPAVFRFEKSDVVGFRVTRDDLDLTVRQQHGVWRAEGHRWTPDAAMVRRVAHQLHELDARTTPLQREQDEAGFGLERASVHVWLRDGRTLAFEVGDPTPQQVSHYLRPIPGEEVMVVARAAVSFAFEPLEAFREDHVVMVDPRDVEVLDGKVDGRTLRFERTGESTWQMTAPVVRPASREQVRRILGRVTALRATRFVDVPSQEARAQLTTDGVRIVTSTKSHTLRIGAEVTGAEPLRHWVYLEEHDVLAEVAAGWLDALRLPLDDYRDRVLVPLAAHRVRHVVAQQGVDQVRLSRTSAGWVDERGPFPGQTPDRVVQQACKARVDRFDLGPLHDEGWSLELTSEEGATTTLRGTTVGDDTLVVVDGGGTVGVGPELGETVANLFREHARRLRDADAPVTP